ncbi:transglutaminase domain-containing protein [Verrucomicrobiaceae bacterium N1E253]|uniref:Transglutaminase domain-containing protein n=1 Tax=Oceaniferula marina TaxID=2748318 RepID=A0A851GHP9_9BACT|nr:transglutaminase domain-containing protein [Oceaniferula marina]NWK56402.1 transglutaminase domain-containing protein [Oceaniferula marina]
MAISFFIRNVPMMLAVIGAYLLLRGWPGGPGLLMRSCLAVATLVAGLAWWGARREAKVPIMQSLKRATWYDYLSLGVAVVLAEALFVLFTITVAGPSLRFAGEMEEVVEGIASVDEETAGSGADEGELSDAISGRTLFRNKLQRQLPKRSNLKPSNKPEVFLQLENEEDALELLNSRIYLHSFSFSRFNGVSWSAARSAPRELRSPIRFPLVRGLPGTKDLPSFRYRVFHAANPSSQNVFISLHGAQGTDLSRLTRLADSIYRLPELESALDGYNYEVRSTPIDFTDLIGLPLQAAKAAPGELDLPTELSTQLNNTADIFNDHDQLFDKLIEMRRFLQDRYDYSLEVSNMQELNPLENFLYEERRGYCEHFATAAAMLCRALGVPSRVAYGWSGGRLYRSQNMFVFRAKDAHAWTEIKLDGYGWVIFDTTPPDDEATPESHAAPESEPAPDPEKVIAEQSNQTKAVDDPSVQLALGADLWKLLVVVFLVVASWVVVLFVRRWRLPLTDVDGRPLHRPPSAYLQAFKLACGMAGCPMPSGRTLRQQVSWMESQGIAPDFLNELLAYHYGRLYADRSEDKELEKQLIHSIRLWRQELVD